MSNNYTVRGFWRAWHCSFNRWLVRYIYIPLGGNRHGALRTALHAAVVFSFVGPFKTPRTPATPCNPMQPHATPCNPSGSFVGQCPLGARSAECPLSVRWVPVWCPLSAR